MNLDSLSGAQEDSHDGALHEVDGPSWGIPLMDGDTIRLARLIGHSHALDLPEALACEYPHGVAAIESGELVDELGRDAAGAWRQAETAKGDHR